MDKFQNIATLGSGIGYRQPIKDELIFDHNQIDFVEIVGEHFLSLSDSAKEELSELMDEYPVIPHFIGLSLGSYQGVDSDYLEQIAKLIDFINPPYWSEHIAFTECHGIEVGHLTPLPYTREALEVFKKNIETVQKTIKTPFILENITYTLDDPVKEMSEPEFLKILFEENPDVGHLLDITNLFVNSTNHNFDWKDWMNTIDTERVIQIHYVGAFDRDGLLIDNHSYPTLEGIWDIMNEVKKKCPNLKGSILERDNRFDSMDNLRMETKRANEILFA